MPTILDAEQLAEVLGMNPKTLQRMGRDGLYPCHRFGNSTRYVLEEVLAHTRVACHGDDLAVEDFAAAMHAGMAAARVKGREGWEDRPVEAIADELMRQAAKGDPVGVGNMAMMLHARGVGRDVLAAAFARQEKARV